MITELIVLVVSHLWLIVFSFPLAFLVYLAYKFMYVKQVDKFVGIKCSPPT